jgi:phage repressor protein C with HTH and peptisase S24 domain
MMDPEISAIDAAMKQQGKSKADLGRLLGLDSAQVSRMFSGKRRLQLHEAKAIHAWLGGEQKAVDIGGTVTPMPGMVPLYGWVGAASDSRLTMAEQNLRGYVPMHPNQAHVRNAFALEVADVSMTPRYEPGEIIYCAPNRWPGRGQDCVLVTTEGEGLLKRFIRRDTDTLTLHQLNPDEDLNYSMETVFAVHTVVGRG